MKKYQVTKVVTHELYQFVEAESASQAITISQEDGEWFGGETIDESFYAHEVEENK